MERYDGVEGQEARTDERTQKARRIQWMEGHRKMEGQVGMHVFHISSIVEKKANVGLENTRRVRDKIEQKDTVQKNTTDEGYSGFIVRRSHRGRTQRMKGNPEEKL